jgi:hypothetical protein
VPDTVSRRASVLATEIKSVMSTMAWILIFGSGLEETSISRVLSRKWKPLFFGPTRSVKRARVWMIPSDNGAAIERKSWIRRYHSVWSSVRRVLVRALDFQVGGHTYVTLVRHIEKERRDSKRYRKVV